MYTPKKIIAAVSIRAEVTTLADYVISILEQVARRIVCKNQTPKKMSQALNYVMLF